MHEVYSTPPERVRARQAEWMGAKVCRAQNGVRGNKWGGAETMGASGGDAETMGARRVGRRGNNGGEWDVSSSAGDVDTRWISEPEIVTQAMEVSTPKGFCEDVSRIVG